MTERRSTKLSRCCWWFWRLFARRQRKDQHSSADNDTVAEATQDAGLRGAKDPQGQRSLRPVLHLQEELPFVRYDAEGGTAADTAVEQKAQPKSSDRKGETLIITITLVKRENVKKDVTAQKSKRAADGKAANTVTKGLQECLAESFSMQQVATVPTPTAAASEAHEEAGDIGDLVLLRRQQQLVYSRVQYVEGEAATDGDGWIECRGRRAKARRPLLQEPPAEAPRTAATTTTTTTTAAARRPSRRRQAAPGPVQASWQEPRVECLLTVPPHLRRHIVGRGGARLQDLRREFPAVRVRVPPPQDLASRNVTVMGPRGQAAAALAHLRASLHQASAPVPAPLHAERGQGGAGGTGTSYSRRRVPRK